MPSILILGIGNAILSDEGVGVHVVRQFQSRDAGPDVRVLDGGTLSFTLAPEIENADGLIVVDAAQLAAPAGTVRVFIGDAMDRFVGTGRRSVHEVSLLDLLDIARLTGTLPAQRALVAIQPDRLDWGCTLSPAVADSVSAATQEVHRLLDVFRQTARKRPVALPSRSRSGRRSAAASPIRGDLLCDPTNG